MILPPFRRWLPPSSIAQVTFPIRKYPQRSLSHEAFAFSAVLVGARDWTTLLYGFVAESLPCAGSAIGNAAFDSAIGV